MLTPQSNIAFSINELFKIHSVLKAIQYILFKLAEKFSQFFTIIYR